MQSISIFQCKNDFNSDVLINKSSSHTEEVNGQNENLITNLYVNEEIGVGDALYQKCVVAIDEVVKLKARVFNRNITELVVNNSYDVYVNKKTGTLACLANKNSAESIEKFYAEQLNLTYDKKLFDLESIMAASNDVRRAQFRKLTIQTLNGSAISGNQVNTTDMYNIMNQSGDLSTVAVSYPFNDRDISFSVSSTGSIVLFSTLTNDEIADFLDILEVI